MDRSEKPAWIPADASRMYRRVLAGWAMDVLALRRAGLEAPNWRTGLVGMPRRAARIARTTRRLRRAGA